MWYSFWNDYFTHLMQTLEGAFRLSLPEILQVCERILNILYLGFEFSWN